MKPRLKPKTALAFCGFGLLLLVFLALEACGLREPKMPQRALEATLRADLRTMREAIDNYTLDKLRSPNSLQDLVAAGYLREIPMDPMTQKADWVLSFGDTVLVPDQKTMGLTDVHSNSARTGTNGSPYNSW